jgi:hypothetical protein
VGAVSVDVVKETRRRAVKLEEAEALWESDCLAREELPEVAVDALIAGLDSPSLRVLAGLNAARMDRAPDLLDRALQELGRRPVASLPPAREAALWAEAITAGAVPLLQGTHALWAMWRKTNDGELKAALLEFRVEQDRWEQASPQHRRGIERQVLTRARAFLARWPATS